MTAAAAPSLCESAASTLGPDAAACGAASAACGTGAGSDLSLLVHRAAHGMRRVVEQVCREHGLNDFRDWMVLTVLIDDADRSQLVIAQLLGIDKSTLTALLDRLERLALVVRSPSPADRRVRIPRCTEEGRRVWAVVARTRDEIETALLADLAPAEVDKVREVLVRLADAGARVPASVLAPA